MIYLNDQPITVTVFPDHTSQVWKLPETITSLARGTKVTVKWDFQAEAEFLLLAQLKALLEQLDLVASLTMSYLPYGRQDKVISNNTTFALYVFAELLNTLTFESVEILDPHSNIAIEQIKNSKATYCVEEVKKIVEDTKADLLCFPDHGALQKYKNNHIYDFNIGFVYGEKVRDAATGNITSYKLLGDVAGKNVLITDDICDGGATFKLLAKDLIAAGAKQVNLFVTHGIFSKGVDVLFDSGIYQIFTKDGEVVRCY